MFVPEAVVARIVGRIGKAEGCRQVQNHRAAREEGRCEIVAGLVGRGEEDRVGAGRENRLGICGADHPVETTPQSRVDIADLRRFAASAVRAEQAHDLDAAETEQAFEQFAAGIAGGAHDGTADRRSVVHREGSFSTGRGFALPVAAVVLLRGAPRAWRGG